MFRIRARGPSHLGWSDGSSVDRDGNAELKCCTDENRRTCLVSRIGIRQSGEHSASAGTGTWHAAGSRRQPRCGYIKHRAGHPGRRSILSPILLVIDIYRNRLNTTALAPGL